jgi:transposase
LAHARQAKLMLASANKTDRLDARGINRLQRSGTLPTVWIAAGELRDHRELFRTRMVLTRQRTRLKNRIHATLAKYGLRVLEARDTFSKRGRQGLLRCLDQFPQHTRYATEALQWLMSLPGVGFTLAVVIMSEIGDISRFPSAARLASYCGTTPRVQSSGGKTRHGQLRVDVNRYLKWAFTEARTPWRKTAAVFRTDTSPASASECVRARAIRPLSEPWPEAWRRRHTGC